MHLIAKAFLVSEIQNGEKAEENNAISSTTVNIGTLSVQELFFQLIGWFGVRLGVSPVGMVYFMG